MHRPMDMHDEIYRLLVNEIEDYAIFLMDPSGCIKTWNPGAERLSGYKAEEILGSHISRFFLPEDIQNGKPAYLLNAALTQGRIEDEGWRVRKDGSMFRAKVVLLALYDHGNHRGFAQITRDVTNWRHAEGEVRELRADMEARVRDRTTALATANEELVEANRMKDDFLATLSHELRTPLTAAFGWLQLLLAGDVEEGEQRRGLQVIDRNLRSQIRLIDDLLNISHIVAGKVRLDLREVDALQIISTAVDSIRPAAEEKNIDLQFLPDRSMAIHAIADGARLHQVVWNLLANAVKFTPPDGRIEVKLERSERRFILRISDTGEGIPHEFLPYVFDRFRQADSSQARKHGGLGIGLSLVRQLVELHGGAVYAESPGKGKGATFTVWLPLRDSRRRSEPPKFPRPA